MALSLQQLREIGILDFGKEEAPPQSAVKGSAAPAAKEAKFDPPARVETPVTADTAHDFVFLSDEEVKALKKEERTAYHKARMAALKTQKDAAPAKGMSKSEQKAQTRAKQEAERAVKEALKHKTSDREELVAELKLQGLSEEQARLVADEMLNGDAPEAEAAEEDGDEEAPDLFKSVKDWMAEHRTDKNNAGTELIREFNLSVRFQGHVNSVPPDHVRCILHVIAASACQACDLTAKLQPGVIAKKVDIEHWISLIEELYGKISDVMEGIDAVCSGVCDGVADAAGTAPQASRDCAVVGVLMAFREQAEAIADEDLLAGCRRVEPRSHVLDKFIEFLEAAIEEGDSDDD